MANMHGYDATGGKTMEDRDCLPAGEYVAAIVKSERRESKKNPGNAFLNLEFDVMDGPLSGRKFWTMVNLWNSNQEAAEIAQREMNSICAAAGRLRINDSEELHGIPMRVKLKVTDDGQYGPQNRVVSYKPLNSVSGGGQGRVAGNAAGDGNTSAPWKRTA